MSDKVFVGCAKGWQGSRFTGALPVYIADTDFGRDQHTEFLKDTTDTVLNDHVDAVYWEKYARWPQNVTPVVTAGLCSSTLKLVPRK